jgi:hypothetical protein
VRAALHGCGAAAGVLVHDHQRAVGGAVVAHAQVEVLQALRVQALQQLGEELRAVAGGKEDLHARLPHRRRGGERHRQAKGAGHSRG